ncbi:T9SS type A sorting domain-containing protein [Chryseobacterium populi]|uniref:Por secretion system C-terminal sorting domain containing protein n=1 Tax=Chryseobacterium populi TaxID=1144316 RepID=J3CAQ1_9FLAO|nr:T9SS type A sorting domain-containing protein [Chryseobacterium populi]EJL67671.1 Por secretion system C-terminal sorting domain containing protein [Chryseobacterium populi]
MAKKLFFLVNIFLFNFIMAQNNFEYLRSWGTYFGPVGGRSWTSLFDTKPILFDSQDNIYVKGFVTGIISYNTSYYQQFSVGNGQPYSFGTGPYPQSVYNAKFNSAGNLLFYEYDQFHPNIPGTYQKELMYIDAQDNKYYQYHSGGNLPVSATPGVWMTTTSSYPSVILAKYSANNTLIWATYLPSLSRVTVDDSENVYISGLTYSVQDITTPRVFQENYQIMTINGVQIQNGFLVKLNPNGQRLWGTYYPGYGSAIQYHNNALYMMIGQEFASNQISIPSPGAFQTTKSSGAMMRMNANTGTRDWGTYYGAGFGNNGMTNFEVNDTGLYIAGRDFITNDPTMNSNNYYGTPGSHQPQISGSGDIFLTKFDHSGNRIWSTYIGGTAWETSQGSQKPLAIVGNDIYVCGLSYGTGSNMATPNVYQQSPQQNTSNSSNHFFVKFSSNGVLQWSSYYGGTSEKFNEPINIAIHKTSLYLYGETTAPSGYATSGCWQPQIIDPNPTFTGSEKNVTFLAKFNIKTLGTFETSQFNNLILYNNPNNGNFIIKGDILEKENCKIDLYDVSGKLIYHENLSKNTEQKFSLQNLLSNGIYFISVTGKTGDNLKNFKMTVKK